MIRITDADLLALRRSLPMEAGDVEYARAVLARYADATELLEALRYARRFLKPADHDTAFIDSAITKATGAHI